MRIGTVTPTDRWTWQQRAYRALGMILEYGKPDGDNSPLPTIEWSIDDGLPAIRGDVRQVGPVDDHWDPYEAFEAWRMALGLTKHWKRHNPHFGQTEYRAVLNDGAPTSSEAASPSPCSPTSTTRANHLTDDAKCAAGGAWS